MSDPKTTAWRPIASAPDDGEPVLITWRCTSGWDMTIARQIDSGVWMDDFSGERLTGLMQPTLWQPRPMEPAL